jgi:hypothetical protein
VGTQYDDWQKASKQQNKITNNTPDPIARFFIFLTVYACDGGIPK